jgi:uncharacterized membrane protein
MAILYPFYKESVLYLLIGGFLIDIDHSIWYFIKFKSLNPKKTLEYYNKLDFKDILNIFHTVEFIFIFSIFCLFFELYLLYAGYIIHIILDIIGMYRRNIFDRRTWSLITWIMRRI